MNDDPAKETPEHPASGAAPPDPAAVAQPTLAARIRTAWKRLRGGSLSPGRAAASVGVGLFVGFLPLYGIHSAIVLAICVPLRLDAAIAYLATHISNPLTAPFLFALEMQVGSLLLTGHGTEMTFAAARELGFLKVGARLLCGAALLSPTVATLGAAVTWLLTLRVQDAREPARARARQRTMARYSAAPPLLRTRLRLKLVTDAALDSITALIGPFGRIVDAGCGFGHHGFSLVDRGRGVSLVGIDLDRRRIEIASAGAGSTARFELADLEAAAFPPADTILFVDSLRFLPLARQDAVLARAAAALAPGGRLVVREVVLRSSIRGRLSVWLERRVEKAARGSDPGSIEYRDPDALVRVLEAGGLTCGAPAIQILMLAETALIVAEKPARGSPESSAPEA